MSVGVVVVHGRGSSHLDDVVEGIHNRKQVDVRVVDSLFKDFGNGEIYVDVGDTIRNEGVFNTVYYNGFFDL